MRFLKPGVTVGKIRVDHVPVEKKSQPAPGKKPAGGKGSKAGNKLLKKNALSSNGPRSLPTSPAISTTASPSLNPTLSASQQAHFRAKEQRFPIVHELAVRERTEEYLVKKWKGNKDDFKTTLEKAADYNSSTKAWTLRKNIWKELDVYNYGYESQEQRQQAIENAVKQYDRIRLAVSDLEWQKLLPVEERGKGKCLSKLQAGIVAKLPTPSSTGAPKIKVQKPEGSQESGTGTDEPPAKPKSSNVFSGGKMPGKKSTTKSKAKMTNTKSANAKPTAKAKEKGRVLSKAIITNSDDDASEDEPLSTKARPLPMTGPPAQAAKINRASSPKPKGSPATSLASKPTATPTSKRTREEDDSSSSSAAPLSKRRKPTKEASSGVIRAPINKITAEVTSKMQPRPSDISSHSRGSNSSVISAPIKVKSTSPAKSSPLATSPPTNASDLEEAETPSPPPAPRYGHGHSRVPSASSVTTKKRPIGDGDDEKPRKRPRVSSAVVEKARNFRVLYEEYESLHHELADLDNPPEDRVANLVALRTRLQGWKKEIYQGVTEE